MHLWNLEYISIHKGLLKPNTYWLHLNLNLKSLYANYLAEPSKTQFLNNLLKYTLYFLFSFHKGLFGKNIQCFHLNRQVAAFMFSARSKNITVLYWVAFPPNVTLRLILLSTLYIMDIERTRILHCPKHQRLSNICQAVTMATIFS